MKSWSVHIATFGGTEVRIHATFFLLLAFFGWQASLAGGLPVAVTVVGFLLVMFLCVLLHEFGHVIAARRFGIHTPDVTLLPIGGLARLERMPKEPYQELIVALAGPAVNVAIALAIIIVTGKFPPLNFDMDFRDTGLLLLLAKWNLFMVLFNMIPAFPMDGGRVLRAVLAMITDYGRATRLAAIIGQGFAVLGAILALTIWANPLLVIIALFIFFSAGQEAAYVNSQEATRGLCVGDAMVTQFQVLDRSAVLQDAVNLLLSGSQHDFPVMDHQKSFVGILTRSNLISSLAAHGVDHPVVAVMEPCETILSPSDDLTEAVEKLRASPFPALPVLDPESERLTGLLTMENIGEMLMVRQALQQG